MGKQGVPMSRQYMGKHPLKFRHQVKVSFQRNIFLSKIVQITEGTTNPRANTFKKLIHMKFNAYEVMKSKSINFF